MMTRLSFIAHTGVTLARPRLFRSPMFSAWPKCPPTRPLHVMKATAAAPSVPETTSEAVSRFQTAGLTLTNPNDLYWMVSFLRKEYFENGTFKYPIKTVCDGELIDNEFYCPFEPKVSPHYIALCNSRDERSQLFAVPPNKTDMKKYNRINVEKFASLTAPNSNYSNTEIVALFYSMMYYLNDQTAHFKLPEEDIQYELVDQLNDHVLRYLSLFLEIFEPRDPADLERIWDFLEFYQPYFKKENGKIVLLEKYQGQTPPQIRLMQKITSYIAEKFHPTNNVTQIIYEVIRYVKGIKQEIKIRCDKQFTLTLKEYDEFRDQVTSSPMAHAATDLTHDNFSYDAYMNPLFIELENLTSQFITYCNDVCTCDRERLDNDPFNSVFILKDRENLNYAEACDMVISEINSKLGRFMQVKRMLLDQAKDETEKKALAQMIKTREDSLIGYVIHEVCCVTDGYARDHKPLLKSFLEENVIAKLIKQV